MGIFLTNSEDETIKEILIIEKGRKENSLIERTIKLAKELNIRNSKKQ